MKAPSKDTINFKAVSASLRSKQYVPVYLLDGDETFLMDKLMKQLEDEVLSPAEKDFNYTALYGSEVMSAEIINAARRTPMFAEWQMVVVKDAASVDDFAKLESYLAQPSPTTILVLEYRNKKLDSKTRVAKLVQQFGVHCRMEKLKEDAVPAWIMQFGRDINLEIPEQEAHLLSLHLGNDLARISNEIEKVRINVPNEKTLSSALIQKYIGINREYNIFEFPEAVTAGDKDKAYRMLTYFTANTKAGPLVLVTISFYTHFSLLYKIACALNLPDNQRATASGVSSYLITRYAARTRVWNLPRLEASLLLISEFNKRAVGIDGSGSDAEQLKEFFGKLMIIEQS